MNQFTPTTVCEREEWNKNPMGKPGIEPSSLNIRSNALPLNYHISTQTVGVGVNRFYYCDSRMRAVSPSFLSSVVDSSALVIKPLLVDFIFNPTNCRDRAVQAISDSNAGHTGQAADYVLRPVTLKFVVLSVCLSLST